jgi:hypothetical protein
MLDELSQITDRPALIVAMRNRLLIDPRALNHLQDETAWGLLVGLFSHWGEICPDKQPMYLEALHALLDEADHDPALGKECWTLIAHLVPDFDREQRRAFDRRCPFPPWPPHLDDARLGALLSQIRAKSALRMVTAEDWKRYVAEVLVPACVDDAGAAVPAINTAFTRLRQLGECVDHAVLMQLAIACLGSPTYPKGTLARWLHNELVLRQSDDDAEASQARVIAVVTAVLDDLNRSSAKFDTERLVQEANRLIASLEPPLPAHGDTKPFLWKARDRVAGLVEVLRRIGGDSILQKELYDGSLARRVKAAGHTGQRAAATASQAERNARKTCSPQQRVLEAA